MIRKMLLVVAVMLGAGVPAMAEEVMPLDLDGSDEYIHEQASSGFDTGGPFAIPADDYDAGDNGDGTWTPDVPDVPDPVPVDDDEWE